MNTEMLKSLSSVSVSLGHTSTCTSIHSLPPSHTHTYTKFKTCMKSLTSVIKVKLYCGPPKNSLKLARKIIFVCEFGYKQMPFLKVWSGNNYDYLLLLQAIGDGGQGWGNFVLYILASDKIRNRLLRCRGDHTEDFKQPILSEHDMEDSTSNVQIKKYGGTVNNVDVSAVPTTV